MRFDVNLIYFLHRHFCYKYFSSKKWKIFDVRIRSVIYFHIDNPHKIKLVCRERDWKSLELEIGNFTRKIESKSWERSWRATWAWMGRIDGNFRALSLSLSCQKIFLVLTKFSHSLLAQERGGCTEKKILNGFYATKKIRSSRFSHYTPNIMCQKMGVGCDSIIRFSLKILLAKPQFYP